MKKLLLIGTLATLCTLATHDISHGHGGTYRGPGGTTPPGGGGSNSSPAPGGGGSAKTPGQNAPNQGPAPSSGGRSGTANSPSMPAVGGTPDPTQWSRWWGYNKDSYINLRGHLFEGNALPSPEDYFLSRGGKSRAKVGVRPSDIVVRGTIVPALLKVLETQNNNDIVTGALVALAKIGDDETQASSSSLERVFLPFLRSGSQEIAETAAVALGVLGNPRSAQTLKSLLLDNEQGRKLVGRPAGVPTRTRAFAAYGLGQIGFFAESVSERRDIFEILWSICESPKQSTRDLKVAAITAMGLVPLPAPMPNDPLSRIQTDTPHNRTEQIRYLLGFFTAERDEAKPEIVRAHAPRAICCLLIGYEDASLKSEVVEALEPYVSRRGHLGSRELRQSASQAFGLLGDLDDDKADRRIRLRLMEATENADPQVRNFSVMALGQIGSTPGTGSAPLAGLVSIRSFLRDKLTKGQTQIRPWAALAMGVMEGGLSDRGIPQSMASLAALREALKGTRTDRTVGAYSIACGIARDLDAESLLLKKYEEMAGDEVRGYTAVGLGLMGSAAAIAPLQEAVKNAKYRTVLLKESAIALGVLRDKTLVHQLLGMLKSAKTLTTQASIASALGFIGDASSVDSLVEMMESKELSAGARGFAAVALGIVADKEDLPWNSKFSVNINYRANVPTLSDSAGKGILDIL